MNDDEDIDPGFEPDSMSAQDNANVSDSIDSAAKEFDVSISEDFNAIEQKKIKTVGAFISNGISEEESCILARIAPERLQFLVKSNLKVAAYIKFKETAYKAKLLQTLTYAAVEGRNAKAAGYLLEQKFPSDFNRKKEAPERPTDILENAIAFVRQHGDSTPVVRLMAPGKPRNDG